MEALKIIGQEKIGKIKFTGIEGDLVKVRKQCLREILH